MSFEDLREAIRQRGLEVHRRATAILREQVIAAAGDAVPEGTVTTTDSHPIANDILSQIRAEPPNDAGTIWQWQTGEPACPFPPHQALSGAVFDKNDWRLAVGKDLDVFPRGNHYWFPGDHGGCQCSVQLVVGDTEFDPIALDGVPIAISAFGRTVYVTPAAPGTSDEIPAWWSATVTPEAWSAAIREAESSP